MWRNPEHRHPWEAVGGDGRWQSNARSYEIFFFQERRTKRWNAGRCPAPEDPRNSNLQKATRDMEFRYAQNLFPGEQSKNSWGQEEHFNHVWNAQANHSRKVIWSAADQKQPWRIIQEENKNPRHWNLGQTKDMRHRVLNAA